MDAFNRPVTTFEKCMSIQQTQTFESRQVDLSNENGFCYDSFLDKKEDGTCVGNYRIPEVTGHTRGGNYFQNGTDQRNSGALFSGLPVNSGRARNTSFGQEVEPWLRSNRQGNNYQTSYENSSDINFDAQRYSKLRAEQWNDQRNFMKPASQNCQRFENNILNTSSRVNTGFACDLSVRGFSQNMPDHCRLKSDSRTSQRYNPYHRHCEQSVRQRDPFHRTILPQVDDFAQYPYASTTPCNHGSSCASTLQFNRGTVCTNHITTYSAPPTSLCNYMEITSPESRTGNQILTQQPFQSVCMDIEEPRGVRPTAFTNHPLHARAANKQQFQNNFQTNSASLDFCAKDFQSRCSTIRSLPQPVPPIHNNNKVPTDTVELCKICSSTTTRSTNNSICRK